MPDSADKRDLEDLEARLKAAKARHDPEPRQVAVSALAQGTRHAFEIAATTIVGGAIGWMLDRWLATGPWMLLLFLLLGIAAGFWNLIKAVNKEAAVVRERDNQRLREQAAKRDDQ
ncbi:AtpZ/AtpI family protein [Sandaracinobacteroides hominis]|uniref:AtpZ/AtpI family protein n=1 Tax=Sandaracinobacteroides hominis TaxID=2780086 RepID=UPI0018F6B2D1|nr:AtpZ/AtpI family protein [Sandaracinobacteroides hominis]